MFYVGVDAEAGVVLRGFVWGGITIREDIGEVWWKVKGW